METQQALLHENGEPAITPYNGTSGWSGSQTSRQRATTADKNGTTKARQQTVKKLLNQAGPNGLTWQELSTATGWHHGTSSGALSVLHKTGTIHRLTQTRNRCKIYVHPNHTNGRPTEPHGRKPTTCPNCGHTQQPPTPPTINT